MKTRRMKIRHFQPHELDLFGLQWNLLAEKAGFGQALLIDRDQKGIMGFLKVRVAFPWLATILHRPCPTNPAFNRSISMCSFPF